MKTRLLLTAALCAVSFVLTCEAATAAPPGNDREAPNGVDQPLVVIPTIRKPFMAASLPSEPCIFLTFAVPEQPIFAPHAAPGALTSPPGLPARVDAVTPAVSLAVCRFALATPITVAVRGPPRL